MKRLTNFSPGMTLPISNDVVDQASLVRLKIFFDERVFIGLTASPWMSAKDPYLAMYAGSSVVVPPNPLCVNGL